MCFQVVLESNSFERQNRFDISICYSVVAEVVALIGRLKVVEVIDRPFELICYCWRPHRVYELWIGSAQPFNPALAEQLMKAFP